MNLKPLTIPAGVFLLGFATAFLSAGGSSPEDVPGAVKEIFAKSCAGCHKGKYPPKGLSWEADKIAAAVDRPSQEVPALKIIDTSAPEESYLLKKIAGQSGIAGKQMPPGKPLTKAEIETLSAWIQGLKKVPGGTAPEVRTDRAGRTSTSG